MIKTTPKVSVVMPVYNREKYVREAVDGILNQIFTDFEFIIIDDASTDNTASILEKYKDQRIKVHTLNKNQGNYNARNLGMEKSRGNYICVMDSDDIALPHRIQTQFDFMEKNTQFGLCGSYIKIIGSDEVVTAPENYQEIKAWLMSNIMFRHPTVFMRKEFLEKHELKYDATYRAAGDYDFLVKAAHLFPVTNIREILLEYRRHPDQISTAHTKVQGIMVNKVMLKQLELFKEDATDFEEQLHLKLMHRVPVKNEEEFQQRRNWAQLLLEKNYENKHYDSLYLASFFKSLLKYIYKDYQFSEKAQKIYEGDIREINKKLKPVFPLNFQKEWTILPDFVANLIKLSIQNKTAVIVECGSGVSSVCLGYMVKNNIIDECYSLEHDKHFYEQTKKELYAHDLQDFVNLIYAPLTSYCINGRDWFWYDVAKIPKSLTNIDMLLVDGPPGQIQNQSRYPALPLLSKYFNNKTRIVMDDTNRNNEKEIISRWINENTNLKENKINTVKGMTILSQ